MTNNTDRRIRDALHAVAQEFPAATPPDLDTITATSTQTTPAPLTPRRRRRRLTLIATVAAVVAIIAGGSTALVIFNGGDNTTAGPGGEFSLNTDPPQNGGPQASYGPTVLRAKRIDNYACFSIHGVAIIWPHGYTATTEDGKLALRDKTGAIVAITGQTITAVGGFGPNNEEPFPPCVKPGDGTIHMQILTAE